MIKIPAKHRKNIECELKKFLEVIHNLVAKGKSASEDDARIVINDVLSYVLGYDKYNELKTEQRERNGRLDYVVKLTDGPLSKKKDKSDFVIEAKAAHVKLNQNTVDQTLQYCLTGGMDYFMLTNVVRWELYRVKRSKNKPDAIKIHEVDFSLTNNVSALTEEFYVFSKSSYVNGDWKTIADQAKATNVGDIVAVLLSDKMVKRVCKEIEEIHDTKVDIEHVRDVIENQIVKSEAGEFNKVLWKKLNKPVEKKKRQAASDSKETVNPGKSLVADTNPQDASADEPSPLSSAEQTAEKSSEEKVA